PLSTLFPYTPLFRSTVHVSGAGLRTAAAGLRSNAPADLALRRGSIVRVVAQQRAKVVEWTIVQWPRADAAFVALDPQSGRVRARSEEHTSELQSLTN